MAFYRKQGSFFDSEVFETRQKLSQDCRVFIVILLNKCIAFEMDELEWYEMNLWVLLVERCALWFFLQLSDSITLTRNSGLDMKKPSCVADSYLHLYNQQFVMLYLNSENKGCLDTGRKF